MAKRQKKKSKTSRPPFPKHLYVWQETDIAGDVSFYCATSLKSAEDGSWIGVYTLELVNTLKVSRQLH